MAAALARRLGVPHVELDELHFGPRWQEVPHELFRARAAERLAGDGWVVDGNYSVVRDLGWERTELVVWLDYALPLVLTRLVRRTVRRIVAREVLWHGNRESLYTHLCTRESLFWWLLTTHRRRRRQLTALRADPRSAHLRWVHFRRPAEADRWLAEVPGSAAGSD
jgi:adenylate kinase family enzyme